MDTRFHAVYLLTSLDPRCEGYFYVGYTVNPARRLRQHNGELTNGALRTSRQGRPWTLVCCVSGFSEDRVALKFEWCWQHPHKSSLLKPSVAQLSGLHRLRHAVGVLLLLLQTELFSSMALRLNIVDRPRLEACLQAVYANTTTRGNSSIPQLQSTALLSIEDVTMDSLKELAANCEDRSMAAEGDVESAPLVEEALAEQGLLPCSLCGMPVVWGKTLRCCHAYCHLSAHIVCLAMHFYHMSPSTATDPIRKIAQQQLIVPSGPSPCPLCRAELHWGSVVAQMKQRTNAAKRRREEQRREILAGIAPGIQAPRNRKRLRHLGLVASDDEDVNSKPDVSSCNPAAPRFSGELPTGSTSATLEQPLDNESWLLGL
jgi:predicted GIY-YIG superfamily endonuclease